MVDLSVEPVAEDGLDALDAPTDADLASVATLASRLEEQTQEVIAATTALRAALAARRQTAEVDLPRALAASGYAAPSKITIAGRQLRLLDSYSSGKLTEERDAAGLDWLSAHGAEELISTVVTVELPAGDMEAARRIYETVRADPAANSFKRCTLERYCHQGKSGALASERHIVDPDELATLKVNRTVYAQVGSRQPRKVELKGLLGEDE